MSLLVKVIQIPVERLSRLTSKIHPALQPTTKRGRHLKHCSIGLVFMITGTYIAYVSEGNGYTTIVIQTIAFAIHGCGCAPFIRLVAEVTGMEQ